MNLRELRKKQHLTQKELADKLSVSLSMVSRYELGQVVPTKERIEEIAKALNVAPDDIDLPISKAEEVQAEIIKNRIIPLMSRTCHFRANGYCELCGKEAPFVYHGQPYLKVHRLDENPALLDSLSNYAALCPNCYEKVIRLKDPEDLKIIKENVKRNMEKE